MVHIFPHVAVITANRTCSVLQSGHGVVGQIGVRLYGGHVRQLFLATVIVYCQPECLLSRGVGHGGGKLVFSQVDT